MKTLLLIASLALAVPSVAHQDQVLSASQTAMQAVHGLVVSGSGSATLRADTCSLRIYNLNHGGQSTQSAYEQALQKKRLEIADVLRPFGLTPTKDNETTSQELRVTLPINEKGEVVFGTATASDVRKALERLEVSSSISFSASNKAQATAIKPLLLLAVKDAKEKAKTLAALGGANTIQLTGMREQGSTSFQPSLVSWPNEGAVRAPEQTLTTSVTLYFAPLAVVLSTRN